MIEATWKIDGMGCEACVRRVTAALEALAGVEVENVSVGGAQVRLDPAVVTEKRVAEAIQAAGYTPSKQE